MGTVPLLSCKDRGPSSGGRWEQRLRFPCRSLGALVVGELWGGGFALFSEGHQGLLNRQAPTCADPSCPRAKRAGDGAVVWSGSL